jgi:hypothetical protein
MNKRLTIIGNEHSVLDHYMNSQFSSYDKVIITKEILFSSFQEDVLSVLEEAPNEALELKDFISKQIIPMFEGIQFNDDFYKHLQDKLTILTEEFDIQLKNYNFMSSISNTKYTLVLRGMHSSVSEYFVEKGNLLSTIKKLCKTYFSTPLHYITSTPIDSVQLEIYVSEEYNKSVFLKKEDDTLLLYASLGTSSSDSINACIGGEMYFSKGEEFYFFENKQEYGVFREYNSFVKKKVQHLPKILSSSDLKTIHEKTKHISSAVIELAITPKGNVSILHVSPLEQPLCFSNSKGVLFHASTNLYDNISLFSFQDEYDQNGVNPQYMMLRNSVDLSQFFSSSYRFTFDGLILTHPCYHPLLDHLGEVFNIDVLYLNEQLSKELDVKYSRDSLEIETKKKITSNNPFSSILQDEEKEKQQRLAELSSLDLSTPKEILEQKQQEYKSVEEVAKALVSSEESSTSSRSSSLMDFGNTSSSSGKKLSAIELMTQSVLNNNLQPKQSQGEQVRREESEVRESPITTNQETSETFEDMFSNAPSQPQEDLTSNTAVLEEITSTQTTIVSQEKEEDIVKSIDSSKLSIYDSIIGTSLSFPASIPADYHLVTVEEVSQLNDSGKIVVLVSSIEEISNPSLEYALPVSIGMHPQAHPLLQSLEDYVLFKSKENSYQKEPFVVLSHFSSELLPSFLAMFSKEYSSFGVICNLNQLDVLKEYIALLSFVHVRDCSSEQEASICKEKLLAFEKKALLSLT